MELQAQEFIGRSQNRKPPVGGNIGDGLEFRRKWEPQHLGEILNPQNTQKTVFPFIFRIKEDVLVIRGHCHRPAGVEFTQSWREWIARLEIEDFMNFARDTPFLILPFVSQAF